MRRIFFITGLTLVLTSCEQSPQARHYQEIVIAAPNTSAVSNPHALMRDIPMHDVPIAPGPAGLLKWQAPQGWQEKPGSAMRLATFLINEGGETAECSIVSLGPEAGSLTANVERWANQMGVKFPLESELTQFIAKQDKLMTKGGVPGTLVDFTSFASGNGKAMIAGMMTVGDRTVFVKMTGSKDILLRNRDKLKSLCQSLKTEK